MRIAVVILTSSACSYDVVVATSAPDAEVVFDARPRAGAFVRATFAGPMTGESMSVDVPPTGDGMLVVALAHVRGIPRQIRAGNVCDASAQVWSTGFPFGDLEAGRRASPSTCARAKRSRSRRSSSPA